MEATIIRNKIPGILAARKMSISDLQRESRLSWPSTYKVATLPVFPDTLNIGTLRRAAEALKLPVGDVVEFSEE